MFSFEIFLLMKRQAHNNHEDEEDEDDQSSQGDFISKPEELKMIYLRSFLNKIEKFYQEKDVAVQKLQ